VPVVELLDELPQAAAVSASAATAVIAIARGDRAAQCRLRLVSMQCLARLMLV
jgi:hypothetical protein